MFIYDLYRFFIKEGHGELDEYFSFIWFSILSLPIDIILLPIEIIAFVMWKRGKKKNEI